MSQHWSLKYSINHAVSRCAVSLFMWNTDLCIILRTLQDFQRVKEHWLGLQIMALTITSESACPQKLWNQALTSSLCLWKSYVASSYELPHLHLYTEACCSGQHLHELSQLGLLDNLQPSAALPCTFSAMETASFLNAHEPSLPALTFPSAASSALSTSRELKRGRGLFYVRALAWRNVVTSSVTAYLDH